jgi:hypothetical protein
MNGSEQHSYGCSKEQNMNMCPRERMLRIRALNDRFRRTGVGGRQLITPGINEMGLADMLIIRQMVAQYDDFSEDNDPHGEHDFGCLTYGGEKIFWKIDYYDETLTWGSPDPTDPAVTTRVLTIMLAREY